MAARADAERGNVADSDNPIARYFEFSRYNVTLGSEIMAGLTTFLVMAYIAFVNPGILTTLPDSAGLQLEFNRVVTGTCWVASILCILMGVYARRPFAMAPGLGLNAVVMFQLVAGQGLTWAQAFGIVVLEGVIITILVLTKFRQAIMDAVPMNLKRAIAAGIGLFILYIGLNNGGIVAGNPGYATNPTVPPVALGNFATPTILVTIFGLLLMAWLHVRGQKAAILIGILGATVFAVILNYIYIGTSGTAIFNPGIGVLPSSVIAVPAMPYFFIPDLTPFTTQPITSTLATFSIMLSDFFDTMGTLVGVGLLAGFLTADGKLPEVEKPLLVDSLGPIVGGTLGASSATTYIEFGRGRIAGRAHRPGSHYGRRPLSARPLLHTHHRDRTRASHGPRAHHGRLLHASLPQRRRLGRFQRGLPRADHHDRHASNLLHHERHRPRLHTLHPHNGLLWQDGQDPPAHVAGEHSLRHLLHVSADTRLDRG